MAKVKNLSGMVFGKLTVIGRDANAGKHSKWICVCECGSKGSYYATNLTTGKSKSCGCKSKETLEKIRKGATKHGLSKTRTYKAWMSMRGRCENKFYPNYPNYGGRGISVCDSWTNSFEEFFKDMGECPAGFSLDRIDNSGNYEPTNCRWASNSEQQNNKRTTRLVTALGRTQTLSEWAKETGLDAQFIRNRLARGWSADDAISIPKKEYNKER